MLNQVNILRAKAGVPALQFSPCLRSSAQNYATYMSQANSIHPPPMVKGGLINKIQATSGAHDISAASELVAEGYFYGKDFINAMIQSYSSTLVSTKFTTIGFGYDTESDEYYYALHLMNGQCYSKSYNENAHAAQANETDNNVTPTPVLSGKTDTASDHEDVADSNEASQSTIHMTLLVSMIFSIIFATML
eukprot:gene8035-9439_t